MRRLTLADLWLQARRRKHLKKTVCLIVDYLQIMGGDGRQAYSNRVQEVAALTSGLKALANPGSRFARPDDEVGSKRHPDDNPLATLAQLQFGSGT